ncbi:MAG: MASE1 domain-containing protein [Aquisalimonadaceae bacterium]
MTRASSQQPFSILQMPALLLSGLLFTLVAAVYFLASEVGMWFMFRDPPLTLIAPASGVALALIYRLGYRVMPAVALAALLYQLRVGMAVPDALLLATGQAVAPLVGVWLLRNFTDFSPRLGRISDVLALVLVGGALGAGVSSAAGALVMAGIGEWRLLGFTDYWWVCWVADLMGVLIISPLLLAWRTPQPHDWPRRRVVELLALLVLLVAVGITVYGDRLMSELTRPLSYVVFPLMIWAAIRFSTRELSVMIMAAAAIAVPFTAAGTGPFIMGSDQANLLSLHGHLGLLSLTGLMLGAATAERRNAMKALTESEAKYRLLVENQSEVVLKLGADTRILFASPSFHRLFGTADGAVVGEPLALPVHQGDPRLDRELFTTLTQPPHAAYLEHRVDIPGGECWLAWACKAVKDDDGTVTGIVCVGRDVTERRAAEARARRHLQELGRVGRISAMGEMAGGLAHELNQPLCAIMSFAQACRRLLDKPESTPELRNALDRVVVNADRAGNIIRQMRAFVRNEEPVLESADMNALIREVHGLTVGDAIRHQVHITLALASDLPPVAVSPIQIQQVLVNLIRNAVEAVDGVETEKGDRVVSVKSSLAEDRHAVEVRVADTGPGIPETMRESLFEPFVTRRVEGLGLGLSISRSIIEAHGGRITLEDQGDHAVSGAQFRVRLPIAEPGVRAHAV